jgi:aryl-alcohol dehydrogenase-like predicted oxidoreductase
MDKRKLGTSGLEVAPLAFGGNVFGWTADAATSFALLDAFTASGGNLVDTADVYSSWKPGNHGGESETIIGEWLKRSGKRDQVVIATKVGKPMGPAEHGLSAAYIERAVDASLRRLQTDHIDLYPPARQGPRHRRVELQCATPGRGARHQPPGRPRGLPVPAAVVQPVRTRRVRIQS